MKLFRARIGIRALLGYVGLCALLSWAAMVSRDSRPAYLHSKALIEGDEWGREDAVRELGRLEDEREVAVPALIRAVRADPSARIRRQAAISLADILVKLHDGPTTEAAASPLVEALADGDPLVRRSAADALGRIGPGPESTLPALLRACGDPDEWVRGAAIGAVGLVQKEAKIDRPEARRAIVEAMNDPSLHVRELGLYAFWSVAERSPAITAGFLNSDDPRYRRAAMVALSRNTSLASRVLVGITSALADPDPGVRAGAANVLGSILRVPEPSLLALEKALNDEDPAVREMAGAALSRIRDAANGLCNVDMPDIPR
jgi:HEAT repeat protein